MALSDVAVAMHWDRRAFINHTPAGPGVIHAALKSLLSIYIHCYIGCYGFQMTKLVVYNKYTYKYT